MTHGEPVTHGEGGPADAPCVGLTGCGAIGALHAKNLAAAGVRLVFHNRTRSKADEFARRFGGEACGDYADLLQRCAAVVVATPPDQHVDAALAALAAGRPVMVEKPLCGARAELERIEAAARAASAGAFVMVAENYYYKPSVAWMREVITWSGIGPVVSMDVQKQTRQVAAGWKSSWGALLEGGIHFVALVADLADAAGVVVEPAEAAAAAQDTAEAPPQAPVLDPIAPLRSPVEVHAQFPTATRSGGAERQSHLELVYDDGLRVRLRYAWDVPSLTKGIFQHSQIDGEAGRIWFESNGLYAHLRGPGRKGWTLPGFADLMGYGAMTSDFLAAVTGVSVAPYSSLARARRDLDIVWRAYEQLP